MGTVILAEQRSPIRRCVALKIVKRGIDSKPVVDRFEAERQALAVMDHQNMARLHDVGVAEDGSALFAMEYVEGGLLLDVYCNRIRLSIRAMLQVSHRCAMG